MSPEVLFAAIGDTPEQIRGLRKLAVAMAITGQLNAIEPSETAEELLERIKLARENLKARGRVPQKTKRLSLEEEDLPEGFQGISLLVPLGEVARVEKGKTAIKKALPGHFPLVVTGPEPASCDHFDFEGPAAIIPLVSSTGHGHASINRLHYREDQFALGTILVAVFPHDPEVLSARFLFEYLTAFKEELLVSRMTGTANVTLTIGRIEEVPVPIISPEVQVKLDGLMALLDCLETTRTRRETTRDYLTTASLTRLTASGITEAEFPSHARFAVDNLNRLTSRPEQMKVLRQAIFNLAVQGKLVEQDPKEGAAVSLTDDEQSDMPFQVPANWTWNLMGTVAEVINGDRSKNYPNRTEYKSTGVPWINTGHIEPDGSLNIPKMHYISRAKYESLRAGKVRKGDLLYCLRGATFGKAALVYQFDEGAIASSLMILRPKSMLKSRFAYLFLCSPLGREQLLRFDNGTAQPNLSATSVRKFWFPLPPIGEQNRIIGKVDVLMNRCERLACALAVADVARDQLQEVLIHEALL